MKRFCLFFACFSLLAGAIVYSEPASRYSMTHSTYIAMASTWSDNTLSSMTVRTGDMLAYVTISSTHPVSLVTIYDGLDSGGKIIAEVNGGQSGSFPFEVYLASSSQKVTIRKSGGAGVGITFYVGHPVKSE